MIRNIGVLFGAGAEVAEGDPRSAKENNVAHQARPIAQASAQTHPSTVKTAAAATSHADVG